MPDDLKEFFAEAMAVKQQRGVDYGNDDNSAYRLTCKALDDPKAALYPIFQKAFRIKNIVEQDMNKWDMQALHDSCLDLVDYVVMFEAAMKKRKQDATDKPGQVG